MSNEQIDHVQVRLAQMKGVNSMMRRQLNDPAQQNEEVAEVHDGLGQQDILFQSLIEYLEASRQ